MTPEGLCFMCRALCHFPMEKHHMFTWERIVSTRA